VLPLPPLPRRLAPLWRPAGPDLLELLAGEHRRLPTLAGARASVLTAAVVRHLSAEEQYLYPVVRAVLPGGAALADAEIAAAAALRRRLPDPFAVVPALRAHARRCESWFPGLRAALDPADLVRLGNRAVIAAEAAPTRPHAGTPIRPPWNRLVEPALGVLDKVRDGLSGRPTYPDADGH
jgi:hypothetical protein